MIPSRISMVETSQDNWKWKQICENAIGPIKRDLLFYLTHNFSPITSQQSFWRLIVDAGVGFLLRSLIVVFINGSVPTAIFQ